MGKKKIVHKASSTDDKKLQSQLKNPKVQASPNANTFAISGNAQVKQISEMLPSIVSQMGPEGFASLRKMAMQGAEAEAAKKDDVPELEGDFEEESKKEEEAAKAE